MIPLTSLLKFIELFSTIPEASINVPSSVVTNNVLVLWKLLKIKIDTKINTISTGNIIIFPWDLIRSLIFAILLPPS